MAIYYNGTYASSAFYDTDDIYIGDVTITPDPTANYSWAEFHTTGSIFVTGTLNLAGSGHLGAFGGMAVTNINNSIDVGGNISQPGGYLIKAGNGDPLDSKPAWQVIPIYSQTIREAVYPGGGGGGGLGVRGGGGGSGGGSVKLITPAGDISITGLIDLQGKKNGGNGVSGTFKNTAPCPAGDCKGTWPNTSTHGTPVWTCGSPGSRSRTGSSNPGNPPSCCKGYISVVEPTWPNCGCGGHWSTNPKCRNDYGGGCCHDGRSSRVKDSPCDCNPSYPGAGGAGGGLMIKTAGNITFGSNNIDLRGAHHADTNNSGTLKIIHAGRYPSWVVNEDGYTKSDLLKTRAGGVYLEGTAYRGYDPDISVPDLTAIASMYPADQEVVALTAYEGMISSIYIPVGMEAYYGIASIKFYSDYISPTEIGIGPLWSDVIATSSWNISLTPIGPGSDKTPILNNEIELDSLGRTWTYLSNGTSLTDNAPGWYLLNESERLSLIINHNLGIETSTILGATEGERSKNRQEIMYTQRQLVYALQNTIKLAGDFTIKTAYVSGYPAPTDPQIINPIMEHTLIEPTENSITIEEDVSPYSNTFWSDNSYTVPAVQLEAYDNAHIRASMPVYWGSYQILNWIYNWGDGTDNLVTTEGSTISSTPRKQGLTKYETHVYYDPTSKGFSGNKVDMIDGGAYDFIMSITPNTNIYTGLTPSISAFRMGAKIFERWPSPVFYGTPTDIIETSRNPQSAYPVGLNTDNKYSETLMISGFMSSLKVDFHDISIARTFPICAWHFDSDLGTANSTYSAYNLNSSADLQIEVLSGLSGFTYTEPGWYKPTLTTIASTTNTTVSTHRYVLVYPTPPSANFDTFLPDFISISAYVPVRVRFVDTSVAYSVPISSWTWSFFDSYDRTQVSLITTSFVPYNTADENWQWHTHDPNGLTVDNSLNNACLTVRTSAFGHRGAPPTVNDPVQVIGEASKCVHLLLLEKEPLADFINMAVSTISATYNATYSVSDYIDSGFSSTNYVSGYAPYTYVSFMDMSSGQSYPIDLYSWDFGNYVADNINLSSFDVLGSDLSAGYGWDTPLISGDIWALDTYPSWRNRYSNHVVEHVYEMPGDYTATLTVYASTTNTSAIKTFNVHVEEILPQCLIQVKNAYSSPSWISPTPPYDYENWWMVSDGFPIFGYSPLNTVFNLTGCTPGSFPIGRIDIDFGDGTEILTIDRWLNNYTDSITGSDPRWYNDGLIYHTYRRSLSSDPSTYTMAVSIYNDKTLSFIQCQYPIDIVLLPSNANLEIIKNRSYENNEIIIMQDKGTGEIFNQVRQI